MKQQHAPEGAQQLSASAALLEAFDDAVLTTDLSGRIVVWNEAAAAVTGWPADAAVGRHVRELIDAPYTVDVDEALVRAQAGRGRPSRSRCAHPTATG